MTPEHSNNKNERIRQLEERVEQLEKQQQQTEDSSSSMGRRAFTIGGAATGAGLLGILGSTGRASAASGQVGAPNSRVNVFADEIDANQVSGNIKSKRLASDYLYAGAFSGSDPDARLSNALNAVSGGQVVYLEKVGYVQNQTIPQRISVIGTISGARNSGSHISGTTWTLKTYTRLSHLGLDNGATLDMDGNRGLIHHLQANESSTITISGENVRLTDSHDVDVTLASSSSNCIVTGNTDSTITDNGSGNIVANNT